MFDILNFTTVAEYVSLRQNTNKGKRTFPTIHAVKDHGKCSFQFQKILMNYYFHSPK